MAAEPTILDELIPKIPGLEENMSADSLRETLKVSQEEFMAAANRLLKKGVLEISIGPTDKLVYCKLKSKEVSYEGLDNEEAVVYDTIAKAGNQGIWTRDIRMKTGLMAPVITKILKSLESKKKIKSVKSVMAGKKKVYMLYELTPDTKVTGDLFYSEQQEFDTEFTDVMFSTTLEMLEKKAKLAQEKSSGPLELRNNSFATVTEILNHIKGLNIFKVNIGVNDMRKVLRSLTFSGRIECSTKMDLETDQEVDCFRAVASLMNKFSLVNMPCGACPVMLQCSDTGEVTPTSCVYLKDWLNQELPQQPATNAS